MRKIAPCVPHGSEMMMMMMAMMVMMMMMMMMIAPGVPHGSEHGPEAVGGGALERVAGAEGCE